jgi:hypothetical protein
MQIDVATSVARKASSRGRTSGNADLGSPVGQLPLAGGPGERTRRVFLRRADDRGLFVVLRAPASRLYPPQPPGALTAPGRLADHSALRTASADTGSVKRAVRTSPAPMNCTHNT